MQNDTGRKGTGFKNGIGLDLFQKLYIYIIYRRSYITERTEEDVSFIWSITNDERKHGDVLKFLPLTKSSPLEKSQNLEISPKTFEPFEIKYAIEKDNNPKVKFKVEGVVIRTKSKVTVSHSKFFVYISFISNFLVFSGNVFVGNKENISEKIVSL